MTSTCLSGLEPADVGQGLEGGDARDGDDGGLLEGDVGRLVGQLVLVGGGVLGEGSLGDAEHLVAGGEAGDAGPTATTRPATSRPGIGCFGLVSPKPARRIR